MSFSFFFFTSLANGGRLLNERICSSRSKIFLLSVHFFMEGFFHPKRLNGSNRICPFETLTEMLLMLLCSDSHNDVPTNFSGTDPWPQYGAPGVHPVAEMHGGKPIFKEWISFF